MCVQSPGVLSDTSASYRTLRILMMRPDMPARKRETKEKRMRGKNNKARRDKRLIDTVTGAQRTRLGLGDGRTAARSSVAATRTDP